MGPRGPGAQGPWLHLHGPICGRCTAAEPRSCTHPPSASELMNEMATLPMV